MINLNLVKKYTKLFVIVSLALLFFKSGIAQNNEKLFGQTCLTAGFGVMETLNIGLDFENNNSQFGFKVGGLIADGEKLFSFTTDYSYYFAGSSKKTGNRTWFAKIGIQYFSDNDDTFSEKATGVITRIGRKMYFSEKVGVKIDLGMFFRIHHKEIRYQQPLINFDWPNMPGMGISFFYQL